MTVKLRQDIRDLWHLVGLSSRLIADALEYPDLENPDLDF